MKHNIILLQIESHTKLISNKNTFNLYQAFMYRDKLREKYKGDKVATIYLEEILKEAEKSLNNILNFYPHN
jgi:hypothetical protein